MAHFDVIIAGGGPAGLSAALILARCRRSVLVCDAGAPRNIRSKSMHGYLSRDGTPPADFLKMARREVLAYDSVTFVGEEVRQAWRLKDGFRILLRSGKRHTGRKMLLATGLVDDVPRIPGFRELYGLSVFHCPYCDAWEWRDRALAQFGKGVRGLKSALMLKTWSRDLYLLTDGPAGLGRSQRQELAQNGILVCEGRIERLDGDRSGRLRKVVFRDGSSVDRDAVFFNTPSYQRSHLAVSLGCRFNKENGVITGKYEVTDVPGLYAAGNILRDVQMVVVAAAEGAKAAFGINTALAKEDRR